MRKLSSDSSSSSDSLEQAIKFKTIYAKQLKKKQALEEKKKLKDQEEIITKLKPKLEEQPNPTAASQDCLPLLPKSAVLQEIFHFPQELKWFVYPKCPELKIRERVPAPIKDLPIYRKKQDIMRAITLNQFVLVTGQTGCGKSTQVPRLIYEYLRATKQKAKIMCVQPRRIAVLNLHQILESQMAEKHRIGYQIGMKANVKSDDQIVFVTNGIFLQRLVHSTEFFNEYPFIILDEVHERDIDTDFILLTIKRVIRQHPRVRVILMSATIDNELFRYYFASDHIDNLLTEENFYKKIMRAKVEHRQQRMRDEDNESDSQEDEKIYAAHSFGFMKSKDPCPTINVTEPGRFKRTFYYLDTLSQLLPKNVVSSRWGGIIFSDKYPNTHRQLYQSVSLIVEEISRRCHGTRQKASVLIFMPGLAEIENLNEHLVQVLGSQRCKKEFEMINVHSTILNENITRRLLEKTGTRHKIIIATNIAESSITVLGVEYVIDFCLSKEVRFDLRSKMENLELVWTSKASSNQRAGRTGRVCDGTIIRLLQKKFYQKLPDYSTPQIQRSSLDRLILRIKLLHQNANNKVFAEPGEVLGSAIQPPNLKNIDSAINSLKFSGGLEWKGEEFFLTSLGRLYVDVPIDITYTKLLVVSQLFGTYQDVIWLVSILSQAKNPIRRGTINRNYNRYYKDVNNSENNQNCDFLALLILCENAHFAHKYNQKDAPLFKLEIFSEVRELKNDIQRRIERKREQFPLLKQQIRRHWRINDKQDIVSKEEKEEYLLRFKMTLLCGFVEHVLRVRDPILDEKQEKRLRLMKRLGIRHKNTICILGSNVLRKPDNQEAERRLVKLWKQNTSRATSLDAKQMSFTLTHGLSYLHFQCEKDLCQFLFCHYVETSKKQLQARMDDKFTEKSTNFVPMHEVLACFGQIDHMHAGRAVTFCREQTVQVDNYSLNRVVNMNEDGPPKFLVTNNIAKQSSRMVARFTTLLPTSIPYIETITHLLFYPFISIGPNQKRNRYQSIQLAKRKHRIPIKHDISEEEIKQANQIRHLLKSYLALDSTIQAPFHTFWERVKKFMEFKRPEVTEEDRWQEAYLKDLFQQRPQLQQHYEDLMQQMIEEKPPLKDDPAAENLERPFMNQIKLSQLSTHFFSNILIGDTTLEWRVRDYNQWKQKKLREVRSIERKAEDKDSYLACGEDSCGLRIAKLIKVGPINGEIFRDLYEFEKENIQELPFNDLDCHFCTLLMSNYINMEYKTYGCKNGHYFAIRLEGENKLKILPFSELMILFPDGSAEKVDFERLQVKDWKRKHDQKAQGKHKIILSTYCFVCNETLQSFKSLQNHIKEVQHIQNVKDLVKAVPREVGETGIFQKEQDCLY